MKKKIPVGIDDFSEIIKQNFYYVDKTGMIKELLEWPCMVQIITRPPHFGRSVNISMLRYFFEIGTDKSLFDGLAISKESELCEKHMGKYPVIAMSFKSVKGSNYEETMECIRGVIINEAKRFSYLLDGSNLHDMDKDRLIALMEGRGIVNCGIYDLSRILNEYYNKRVIILIDDYDKPLQIAYENGYYKEMVDFLNNMFGWALKGNPAAHYGLLMGSMCLSIESMWDSFNNYIASSANENFCDRWFGFTDSEIRKMLDDYGLEAFYDTTKEWYGGYKFGRENVFCSRDVINWCNQLVNTEEHTPQNYWIDCDGTDIVRELAKVEYSSTCYEVGRLLNGRNNRSVLIRNLSYRHIIDCPETMINCLYAFGYLTHKEYYGGASYKLCIPNKEIRDALIAKADEETRELWDDDFIEK